MSNNRDTTFELIDPSIIAEQQLFIVKNYDSTTDEFTLQDYKGNNTTKLASDKLIQNLESGIRRVAFPAHTLKSLPNNNIVKNKLKLALNVEYKAKEIKAIEEYGNTHRSRFTTQEGNDTSTYRRRYILTERDRYHERKETAKLLNIATAVLVSPHARQNLNFNQEHNQHNAQNITIQSLECFITSKPSDSDIKSLIEKLQTGKTLLLIETPDMLKQAPKILQNAIEHALTHGRSKRYNPEKQMAELTKQVKRLEKKKQELEQELTIQLSKLDSAEKQEAENFIEQMNATAQKIAEEEDSKLKQTLKTKIDDIEEKLRNKYPKILETFKAIKKATKKLKTHQDKVNWFRMKDTIIAPTKISVPAPSKTEIRKKSYIALNSTNRTRKNDGKYKKINNAISNIAAAIKLLEDNSNNPYLADSRLVNIAKELLEQQLKQLKNPKIAAMSKGVRNRGQGPSR